MWRDMEPGAQTFGVWGMLSLGVNGTRPLGAQCCPVLIPSFTK